MLDLAIVIVSYNTKNLLATCLRTVYASEGDFSMHVTVVDNKSSDIDGSLGEAGDSGSLTSETGVGSFRVPEGSVTKGRSLCCGSRRWARRGHPGGATCSQSAPGRETPSDQGWVVGGWGEAGGRGHARL